MVSYFGTLVIGVDSKEGSVLGHLPGDVLGGDVLGGNVFGVILVDEDCVVIEGVVKTVEGSCSGVAPIVPSYKEILQKSLITIYKTCSSPMVEHP